MSESYMDSAKQKVVKNAPYVFAGFIRVLTHGIFLFVRFLGQVLRDAIGR